MEPGNPKAMVLVVEDDIHLLDGIRDVLELDGYAVLTAQNGVQGLDLLRAEPKPPDLIVSDIMMPHMDGIEFFEAVRKEPRWLSIPFIFLTARGEKADYYKGMRLGADDYVVKPYDPPDLLVKIESRLERYRKLNQAHHNSLTNLKRQILTILNHEFRTPLTFVVAYADMLNAQEFERLNENETLAYLRGVSAGADRLRSLIENFILLVELETGDAQQMYEWRKAPIDDLAAVFRQARQQARLPDFAAHPLQEIITPPIPPFVGDPEYLATAIAHLLNNAAKFSDAGKPIRLKAWVEGDELHIAVEDEGRGIKPSEMAHIWESFYQVERALHEDQGAGAGLAIVRGIAQLHGGRAEVSSTYGQGSTFTLILPIKKPGT